MNKLMYVRLRVLRVYISYIYGIQNPKQSSFKEETHLQHHITYHDWLHSQHKEVYECDVISYIDVIALLYLQYIHLFVVDIVNLIFFEYYDCSGYV